MSYKSTEAYQAHRPVSIQKHRRVDSVFCKLSLPDRCRLDKAKSIEAKTQNFRVFFTILDLEILIIFIFYCLTQAILVDVL